MNDSEQQPIEERLAGELEQGCLDFLARAESADFSQVERPQLRRLVRALHQVNSIVSKVLG